MKWRKEEICMYVCMIEQAAAAAAAAGGRKGKERKGKKKLNKEKNPPPPTFIPTSSIHHKQYKKYIAHIFRYTIYTYLNCSLNGLTV